MRKTCTGCGEARDELRHFDCTWTDGKQSLERFCSNCRLGWMKTLVNVLGCVVTERPAETRPAQE